MTTKLHPFMTALLAIILFFLITSLLGFYQAIRPAKIISRETPKDFGFDFEEVTFKTSDNLMLKGWFVLSKNPAAKTIVCLHGYPADKGDIFPAVMFLTEQYNLFLFDFRYLGESEGKLSAIGLKESEDLVAAIRFLKTRGIEEIGVWGFSMGGAVALMAAAQTPEIKAVVSDSSYARLDLLAPDLFRFPLLKHPLGWLTTVWARTFLRVNPLTQSPEKTARQLSIPILLIHSKTDEVISFKHALLLQEALKTNPKARFWFQENLIHGQVGPEYQEKVKKFFEEHL